MDIDTLDNLTHKQRLFVTYYVQSGNATQSAIQAGYSEDSARQIGSENLSKPDIQEAINEFWSSNALTAAEIISRIADIARFDLTLFLTPDNEVDIPKLKAAGYGHMVKSIKKNRSYDRNGKLISETVDINLKDGQRALEFAAKILGLGNDNNSSNEINIKVIAGFDPSRV